VCAFVAYCYQAQPPTEREGFRPASERVGAAGANRLTLALRARESQVESANDYTS
jgi:hypothetical protein